MTFLSARKRRTPLQNIMRRTLALLFLTAFIWMLSMIPYDILREERFRLYGESITVGQVESVRTAKPQRADESPFIVDYFYTDQDGIPRTASARLPRDLWLKFKPGSRVKVLYPPTQPKLARIKGEIEPPFQTWLRSVLN